MSTPKWITPAGSVGVYPADNAMEFQLAAATLDSLTITYTLISGHLPTGLSLRVDGLILGTPPIVADAITHTFVVRATEPISGNIADRTFEITISGTAIPTITTPNGSIANVLDSVWLEIPIEYDNPISENPIYMSISQGSLPPGLEINEFGLIRGYPKPPVVQKNYSAANTLSTATDSEDNTITVLSTYGMFFGRPIIFTGTSVGGIVPDRVYYIYGINTETNQITISEESNGSVFTLTTDVGYMTVTMPATQIGQPTTRQYPFTVKLASPAGNTFGRFTITVVNHYLPTNAGGPNPTNPPHTRIPTIYNTRPPTYNIEDSNDYGYFVLPPVDEVAVPGETYETTQYAYMGQFLSGEYFAFKIMGHDFDDDVLTYEFSALPAGLTGDSDTGWIYGTPTVSVDDIDEYTFTVVAKKLEFPDVVSPTFSYSFRVANNINGYITWLTDSDLGTINNATPCYKLVEATCDVPLVYALVEGELPPNLTFVSNGEIQGTVAYQPVENTFREQNETDTFTFTIRAYNPDPSLIDVVVSEKTFTLTIRQFYGIPTDSLYIKCTPSIKDRNIIKTLLNNEELIPADYLYRPEDYNFGKASSVIYTHAYGVFTSTLPEYLEAVQKNHYWRNITLGELKTAEAKDENGNIIYEVVYSDVIDNLQSYDPNYSYDYRYSTSVSESIYWPRFIPLNIDSELYNTSSTDIYTSYIYNHDVNLVTNLRTYDITTQILQNIITQQGEPTFYTSIANEYVRLVYPNSLENMRKRVSQELGADYNAGLLPLWMTSQQSDGNTLGFTPAWVICYTKSPLIVTLTADRTYTDTNTIEVSSIEGLEVNHKIVFSGSVFGNLVADIIYYIVDINSTNNRIKVSTTYQGSVFDLTNAVGLMTATSSISYAETIKNNIGTNWDYTLNQINFQIDRFTVDKQLTYNYNDKLNPKVWTRLPSATPTPEPIDSENFYVLFPQKTILPNKAQYNF